MFGFDCFPSEVTEMIIDRLDHAGQVALSKVSHHFHSFLPRFELPTLKLLQNSNVIIISSRSLDRSMAQQFFACHNHSIKTWKIRNTDKSKFNCFRKFAFPPTEKFSFFAEAKIGHLEISKDLPVYFDNDNIDHLTSLLSGCVVDKMTVILDKQTLKNVDKLPVFLASIQVKHLEVFLEKTSTYDMLTSFMKEEFAHELAKAGVREVTFSGHSVHGRTQDRKIKSDLPGNKTSFPFEIITNLVEAGIETVRDNQVLENERGKMNRKELVDFLAKLSECGRSAKIELNLIDLDNDILPNRESEIKEAKDGRVIHVVKYESSNRYVYRVNIEIPGSMTTI